MKGGSISPAIPHTLPNSTHTIPSPKSVSKSVSSHPTVSCPLQYSEHIFAHVIAAPSLSCALCHRRALRPPPRCPRLPTLTPCRALRLRRLSCRFFRSIPRRFVLGCASTRDYPNQTFRRAQVCQAARSGGRRRSWSLCRGGRGVLRPVSNTGRRGRQRQCAQPSGDGDAMRGGGGGGGAVGRRRQAGRYRARPSPMRKLSYYSCDTSSTLGVGWDFAGACW